MTSEEEILMSEAVEIPDTVMQRIERLRAGPEETPLDVITSFLIIMMKKRSIRTWKKGY